ncbi:aminodeoxychorismate synthase component I [Nesterenkonia marinintestina]|uniref:aminodeoxychorismate synthase component I n=1 Tax=Nesterenkonia marinintestina TaxID=2979865 RepID=UPI0021BEE694|nr:aminodeoxychorismate synthase component I [Nesterenkonia sp. GX14115]
MRTCLVDNYDSYTFNLYQLVARVYGVPPVVVTNDDPRLDDEFLAGFDALMISPGPGMPQHGADVGRVLELLEDSSIPVLGVCLGHQELGLLAGADVGPAPTPRHGRISPVSHTGLGLFAGLPQDFPVVRYHSHCLRRPLPERLVVDAVSEDGVVMAFHDVHRPWWGVQFHPESVASGCGTQLLENFRDLVDSASGPGALQAPTSSSLGRGSATDSAPDSAPDSVEPAEAPWALVTSQVPGSGDPGSLPDPAVLFEAVCGQDPWAFWLDSSSVVEGYSRFSYLGVPGGRHGEVLRYRIPGRRRPTAESPAAVEVLDPLRGTTTWEAGSIFDVLPARLRARRLPGGAAGQAALPFEMVGGYVGHLGYELREECGSPTTHRSQTHDAVFVAATRYLVIDHDTGTLWTVSTSPSQEEDLEEAQQWAAETAVRVGRLLRDPAAAPQTRPMPALPSSVEPTEHLRRPREGYIDDVEACLLQLHAGESYEICLTDEFVHPFSGDPFAAYLAQRRQNPAPYAAFLRLGETQLLCSSPERFLKVDAEGTVESKPIKGTAPRSADPRVDDDAAAELRTSTKTWAENLMIVDLLRNDLGRVCEVGSVEVPEFMAVESYATVHQLVSTIRGRLRPDVDAVDAVRACFPGGSMTGAPKLRTMRIIDELEGRARGPYSGAIGYFSADGACDLNIVIRTAVVHGGEIRVGAGGAVVLESEPAAEFEEMVTKLRAGLPRG